MTVLSAYPLFVGLMILCTYRIEAIQERKANPSAYVKDDVWEEIQEYLIPDDHPVKGKLDQIFSSSRAFADQKSMKRAGFAPAKPESHTGIIVTRHPMLQGYVIKAYLDDAAYLKGRPEYIYWCRRVKGARLVQKVITAHGYEHLFKVPRKWIYLLPDEPSPPFPDEPLPPFPDEPSPPSKYLRKVFILVEDDMNILNNKKNEKRWKSKRVSKELLKGLYTITTESGLSDSTKPDNCPFSKDGKVAFVDTQTFNRGYVKYDNLKPYLSPSMKAYWEKITEEKNEPANLSR